MTKKWIQKAIQRPGALTRKAKKTKKSISKFTQDVLANPKKYSTQTVKQANLAKTLKKIGRQRRKK